MPLPRVAIIEDDTDTRDISSLILSSEGFAVSTFAACDKALPQVLSHPPALILLDLNLQTSSLTPQQFVEAVRSAQPGAKILLVSASSSVATIAKSMGVAHYVAKPFGPEELVAAVRKALGQALSPKA
jgi:DNA-binding response OmpR family regulator